MRKGGPAVTPEELTPDADRRERNQEGRAPGVAVLCRDSSTSDPWPRRRFSSGPSSKPEARGLTKCGLYSLALQYIQQEHAGGGCFSGPGETARHAETRRGSLLSQG